MSRGRYSKEELDEGFKLMDNQDKMSEWAEYLSCTEPELYDFIRVYTAKGTAEIVANKSVSVKDAQMMSKIVMAGMFFMYIVDYNKKENKVKSIMAEHNANQFDHWLAGRMPSKFYEYKSKGVKKSSSLYTAKMNHKKYISDRKKQLELEKDMLVFDSLKDTIQEDDRAIVLDSEIII